MAANRNWADLPSDLLHSIAQLMTTTDYFRFGVVCTRWGSSSSPRSPLPPPPPERPFLLLPEDGDEGNESNGHCCTLVRFSDLQRRSLGPIPELRGKRLVGSQNGWIGLLDERDEVTFLNPLTRAQIHLPSVATIAGLTKFYFDNDAFYFCHRERNTQHFFIGRSVKKIVLSSTAAIGSGYAAMAIFSPISLPMFAAEGSGEWTVVADGPAGVHDIIYHDGKFLAVAHDGGLWALDPKARSSPPRMTMIVQGWLDEYQLSCPMNFLVDSSVDLLKVWMLFDHDVPNNPPIDVRIMKFVPEPAKWVPFMSLGDSSLFLGQSYSISSSSREIPEMKPNCIYFTEMLEDEINENDIENPKTNVCKQMRELFVFNLEDKSLDRYRPPEPRLNWPPPLWFTPSLL